MAPQGDQVGAFFGATLFIRGLLRMHRAPSITTCRGIILFVVLQSIDLLPTIALAELALRRPRKVGFSQTLTEPVSSIWNGCDIWSH